MCIVNLITSLNWFYFITF